MEELSTKLMAKLAEVQSLESGTFFIGNAEALGIPTTVTSASLQQTPHVHLPGKWIKFKLSDFFTLFFCFIFGFIINQSSNQSIITLIVRVFIAHFQGNEIVVCETIPIQFNWIAVYVILTMTRMRSGNFFYEFSSSSSSRQRNKWEKCVLCVVYIENVRGMSGWKQIYVACYRTTP